MTIALRVGFKYDTLFSESYVSQDVMMTAHKVAIVIETERNRFHRLRKAAESMPPPHLPWDFSEKLKLIKVRAEILKKGYVTGHVRGRKWFIIWSEHPRGYYLIARLSLWQTKVGKPFGTSFTVDQSPGIYYVYRGSVGNKLIHGGFPFQFGYTWKAAYKSARGIIAKN